jgi:cell division septation protein DedD
MREMHKWKDKAEFSLDNRQIFFLFFGLSVIGCFVFALGVMVGRRVELPGVGEVAALSPDQADLLEGGLLEEEPELTFKEGLRSPGTEGFPPTRDLEAEANEAAKEKTQSEASPDEAVLGEKSAEPVQKQAAPTSKAAKGDRARPDRAKRNESTLAAGHDTGPKAGAKVTKTSVDPSTAGRRFTLQMKAFARAEEAEAFAEQLRAKDHKARVEANEVRGRLWHRVRVGSFETWDSALAAKSEFESSEHIIAYVVRE